MDVEELLLPAALLLVGCPLSKYSDELPAAGTEGAAVATLLLEFELLFPPTDADGDAVLVLVDAALLGCVCTLCCSIGSIMLPVGRFGMAIRLAPFRLERRT